MVTNSSQVVDSTDRALHDVVAWSQAFWTSNGFEAGESLAIMASVGRLAQLINGEIERLLKPLGLSLSRYLLLMTLLLTEEGSRPMNRLGWHMMVHPTTVTLVVDQLQKDGLVKRTPHPTDRRATLIEMTPAGKALAEKSSRLLGEANFGLPEMDPAQTKALLKALMELRAVLGDC